MVIQCNFGKLGYRPHSITIDHENNIWLVDDSNQIHKMSKEGKNLLTIGDGKKAPPEW